MAKKRRQKNVPNQPRIEPFRLRVHPKAHEVANKLHSGAIVQQLRKTFHIAASASSTLRECTHFSLLDGDSLKRLAEYHDFTHAAWFWPQMNQLIILIARGASRSVQNLVDALTWAIGSRNELALAMAARALLEHSAALNRTRDKLSSIAKRLEREIWPHFHRTRNDLPQLLVTEGDEGVRRELLCFAVGRVVQVKEDERPSRSDPQAVWDKFISSMNKVPAEIHPKKVGRLIEQMGARHGRPELLAIYRLLSEFCHPNSASRSLDFRVFCSDLGTHSLTTDNDAENTASFVNIFSNCCSIIPVCCKAIEDALAILLSSHKPLSVETLGQNHAFPGAMSIIDDFGRQRWVEAASIAFLPSKNSMPLSAEQKERIARLEERLGPQGKPLEESLRLFECEGPNAENEIRMMEHMVNVYERELMSTALSPGDLWAAILASSLHRTIDDLIRSVPDLKRLPEVEKIFRQVKCQE